jgi:hypothetical protein
VIVTTGGGSGRGSGALELNKLLSRLRSVGESDRFVDLADLAPELEAPFCSFTLASVIRWLLGAASAAFGCITML